MNYEQFSDTLDKKMFDFNLKILAFFASILIKPLALATEPFFRKNFGDRYLTGTGFLISLVLWNLVEKASYLMEKASHLDIKPVAPPILQKLNDWHCYNTASWLQVHNFAHNAVWIVCACYGLLAGRNYAQLRSRRRKGKIWYSMSPGESIFGSEDILRDILIAIFATIILFMFAPPLGAFFGLSQYASHYLATKRRNAFYNRYLDIVDAKVENEFMQRALDKGEPPEDTAGLFCPLPKAVKGEYRARVARVVASTQFAPGAAAATQGTPQPQPQPSSETVVNPSNTPDELVRLDRQNRTHKVNVPPPMSFADFKKLWDWGIRIRRFFIVGLVIMVCLAAGIAIVRFVHSHRKPPIPTSSVEPQREQTAKVNPAAASTASIQNQYRATPPVVQPATVVNTAPAPANSTAPAKTASEQERGKILEQLKTLAAAEAEKTSKFKDDSENRLAGELLDMQGVTTTDRISLNRQIGMIQKAMLEVVKSQENDLNCIQTRLADGSTIPTANLQKVLNQLQANIPVMEAARQEINKGLDILKTSIDNAASKRLSHSY